MLYMKAIIENLEMTFLCELFYFLGFVIMVKSLYSIFFDILLLTKIIRLVDFNYNGVEIYLTSNSYLLESCTHY